MSCLDRFLDLNQDFWDWKVVSRQNRDFLISIKNNFLKLSRFSQPLRLTFFWCRDRESLSRVSIETTSRQIETPRLIAYAYIFIRTGEPTKCNHFETQRVTDNIHQIMTISKSMFFLYLINSYLRSSQSRSVWGHCVRDHIKLLSTITMSLELYGNFRD
jgi:hypothetical protein